MCPRDTSPEAWEVFQELQRRMSPGEKLARVFEHSAFVRSLILAGIRRRHPSATEREVFLRFARQTLGQELYQKVYGEPILDDEPIPTAHC
jgi:hypothetical protein